MFDQLKQLKQLKDLQDKLGQEEAEEEKNGVVVRVNGKMEILKVRLNPELDLSEQEKLVADCANQAMKKIQLKASQMMRQTE